MARDTKLRMSVDPKIVERLNDLESKINKAVEHKTNAYKLKQIRLPIQDSTDYILFDFNNTWSVKRCTKDKVAFSLGDNYAKDGWEITKVGDSVMITTFGKMAVDINREVEECLVQVQIKIDVIENPIYCPKCDHCGETGCCGFIGFLEKHVRGKTDCIYEDQILDDLEEWIRSEDD